MRPLVTTAGVETAAATRIQAVWRRRRSRTQLSTPIRTYGTFQSEYTVLKKIGAGACGVVFHAVNNITSAQKAVKRVLLDGSRQDSCICAALREPTLLSHLHNRNILRINAVWLEQIPSPGTQQSQRDVRDLRDAVREAAGGELGSELGLAQGLELDSG